MSQWFAHKKGKISSFQSKIWRIIRVLIIF